jgi:predicted HTH domain antitoxin
VGNYRLAPNRAQLRDLAVLAEELGVSRSEVARRALAAGIHAMNLELALDKYAQEKITLARAAQFAGVSISSMADAAAGRGIPYFRYPASELLADVRKLQAVRTERSR